MEPALLLSDKRKLVYRHGASGKRLRRIRESDILFAGDARWLANTPSSAAEEYSNETLFEAETDYGSDFSYQGDDGLRTAVQLKLPSRDPAPGSIRSWFDQLQRAADKSPARFQRAELWLLARNASTLTIWSDDERGHGPLTYGLVNVVSTESSRDSERKRPIDSAYIQERVDMWRSQLQALFGCITEWLAGSHYRTDQGSTVRMDEELMQLFAVDPVDLPVLNILRTDIVVATARPIGLWIIGANGRVDILTAKDSTTVVNLSRDPAAPDWQVYLGSPQSPHPFDKYFLRSFLLANDGT